MKFFLLLSLLFAGNIFTFSQTSIDSLRALLDDPGADADKSNIMILLAREYAESSPDSAVILVNQVLANMATDSMSTLRARAYVILSSAYSYKAVYDQSVQYALEALAIAEKIPDTVSIIDACNNLGIDFMFAEDYTTAFDYFNRVRVLSEAKKDSLRLGHAHNNLGMVEYYRENTNEELTHYLKSRQIFEKIKNPDGLGNALLNIGTVHTDNERFTLALEYYEKALIIFRELGYVAAQGSVLQSISENYLSAGNLEEALEVAMKSREILKEDQFKYDVTFSYELIEKIYRSKSNFKKAHEYLKKYHELNDIIFDEQKSKQINQLHIEYETKKKQQEIALLTARDEISQLELAEERRNIVLLTIVFFFTLALGTYIYFSNRRRQMLKNRLLSSEINELRAQIKGAFENTSSNFQINREKLDHLGITPLSDREVEILNFAMSELTNSEIAEKAFVSVNTVKFHLKNIYGKLGVGNTREALQNALQFPGT